MEEKIINLIIELNDEFDGDCEQNLIEDGILDSLNIMKLITMLEDEFDVEIPVEYFTSVNFSSVNEIKRLLESFEANN